MKERQKREEKRRERSRVLEIKRKGERDTKRENKESEINRG